MNLIKIDRENLKIQIFQFMILRTKGQYKKLEEGPFIANVTKKTISIKLDI